MNDAQEQTSGLDAARAIFLRSVPLQKAPGNRVAEFVRWYEIFETHGRERDRLS